MRCSARTWPWDGGGANARDVAMALQRYWKDDKASFADELTQLAGLAGADLQLILEEVERRVSEADGDVQLALLLTLDTRNENRNQLAG